MYRPHFAFPLAASYGVIPLEQDVKARAIPTITANKITFFIVILLN
jgi:hypothetical protein